MATTRVDILASFPVSASHAYADRLIEARQVSVIGSSGWILSEVFAVTDGGQPACTPQGEPLEFATAAEAVQAAADRAGWPLVLDPAGVRSTVDAR